MARPTKYKPEYCEQVIELMAEGASIEEVAYELRFAVKTLYNWGEKYPEFLQAIERGKELSLGWWMKQGRTGIRERVFQTGLYMIQMANRFGWASKAETTQKVETSEPIQVILNGTPIKIAD